MSRSRDYVGQKFGRLTVISRAGLTNNRRNSTWNCRCDCGSLRVVSSGNLPVQKSCGCLTIERLKSIPHVTHAGTTSKRRTVEYNTWHSMMRRCHEITNPSYPYYGGAGISVCDRWRFGEDGMHPFSCFLQDMGLRPAGQYSLDRFPDNKGNYEPTNCRWATQLEQQRNRTNNRVLWVKGKPIILSVAAEQHGIHDSAVSARLKAGWSVEAALDTPSRSRSPTPPGIRSRKK